MLEVRRVRRSLGLAKASHSRNIILTLEVLFVGGGMLRFFVIIAISLPLAARSRPSDKIMKERLKGLLAS